MSDIDPRVWELIDQANAAAGLAGERPLSHAEKATLSTVATRLERIAGNGHAVAGHDQVMVNIFNVTPDQVDVMRVPGTEGVGIMFGPIAWTASSLAEARAVVLQLLAELGGAAQPVFDDLADDQDVPGRVRPFHTHPHLNARDVLGHAHADGHLPHHHGPSR